MHNVLAITNCVCRSQKSTMDTRLEEAEWRSGVTGCYMAYLCVQSFASWLYRSLSVLYMRAISGTRGSSGFGSVSSEQMDSRTSTTQHNNMILNHNHCTAYNISRINAVVVMQSFLARVISYTVCLFVSHDFWNWNITAVIFQFQKSI